MNTGLQTAALVLGIISAVHPCLMVASLVVGIIAIVKAKEGPARAARWRPIVGLCCTGVWMLVWIAIISVAAFKS